MMYRKFIKGSFLLIFSCILFSVLPYLNIGLNTVDAVPNGRTTYGPGYYTNIFGSGYDATFHLTDWCEPDSGFCDGLDDAWIVMYTCDGEKTQCKNNNTESKWIQGKYFVNGAYPLYDKNDGRFYREPGFVVPRPGQTVQIDVFSKKCRVGADGWECAGGDLLGYMVWYFEGQSNYGYCGDGVTQANRGEQCDLGNLNGNVCSVPYGQDMCYYCSDTCKIVEVEEDDFMMDLVEGDRGQSGNNRGFFERVFGNLF